MQQTVEDCAGDDVIAEDLAPRAEALIAGDDDRATLVTARDQLEEEVGALPVDRQIANLVADQQLRLGQQLEPLVEFAFGQRFAERGNQRSRRDEQRAHVLLTGLDAEAIAKWLFPTPGGPSNNKLSPLWM